MNNLQYFWPFWRSWWSFSARTCHNLSNIYSWYFIIFLIFINQYFANNFLSQLALNFRTFLENMMMSSSLSKILETELKVFNSNSRVIKKIKKYYETSSFYECFGKKSIIMGCNIWIICLKISKFQKCMFWQRSNNNPNPTSAFIKSATV